MNNSLSPLELSEQLMTRGWWDEARQAISRPDVAPANQTLQLAAIEARQACVEWITAHAGQTVTTRDLLRQFDRYTVYWVLYRYNGEGASEWQLKSVEVNGQTD